MGTIAEKLNYLNDTKGLFKNRINSLGGEITEQTTFRNYITWLDKFYNEVSDETDMAENGIVGDTDQESTTGKNLLPNNLISQTKNGLTLVLNNDKSVTINGTATADTNFSISENWNLLVGTYTLSGTPPTGSDNTYKIQLTGLDSAKNDTGSGKTFTTTSDYVVGCLIKIYNGTTINNLTFKPQLESGSSVTSYEPYTGGQPSPSPDFPQEIKNRSGDLSYKVTGKNLFDGIYVKLFTSGGSPYNCSYDNNVRSAIVKVKPNTTYTISKESSNRFRIGQYDEMPVLNLPSIKFDMVGDTLTNYTITTENKTEYLLIQLSNNNEEPLTQVELGNIVSGYEPYISRTFPINLKSKNLFDKDNVINNTYLTSSNVETTGTDWCVSDYIKVQENEKFTYQGLTTVGTAPYSCYYDNNKNFISSFKQQVGENTITIPDNAVYVRFSIRTTVANYDLNTFMIEENDHATDYMPYTTPYDIQLCKQDTYKDFIKRSTGKNLFDKDNATTVQSYISSAGVYRTSTNNVMTIIFPTSPNKTYTVSKMTGTTFRLAYSNNLPSDSDTLLGLVDATTSTNATITVGSEAKYLLLYVYSTNETMGIETMLNSIQIEEGNSPSEFEPYGHQFYLHKDIGEVVLDGSEEWSRATATDGFRYVYKALANNIIYPSSGAIIGMVLSNMFIPISANQTSASVNGIAIGNTGNLVIYYDEQKDSGIERFKTWLSTHNTKVQYVLQTPTTEVISEENYPVLYKQLSDIQDYLTSYKINKKFILGYDEPSVEY